MEILRKIAEIDSSSPSYNILVKGGAAAYWYINLMTVKKVPLQDVDLILNNPSLDRSEIAQDFFHRIDKLLPQYKFELIYDGYHGIPIKISSEVMDIDLFVNEEVSCQFVKLEGLPVPKLCTLIEREEQDVQTFAFEQGEELLSTLFTEKAGRKATRLEYMKKMEEELKTTNPEVYAKLFC